VDSRAQALHEELRRDGNDLTLTLEHRAASSPAPIAIALAQRGSSHWRSSILPTPRRRPHRAKARSTSASPPSLPQVASLKPTRLRLAGNR